MPEYGGMSADASKLASRAALISAISTAIVVAVKLLAAWLSHSISVLAEALQSSIDVLVSLMAVAIVRYSAKPPDPEHPYGHGKAELLSSALQMVLIIGSSGYILWTAYVRFQSPQLIHWNWGAAAMAYTALANTAVSLYLKRVTKRTHSEALAAEALHLQGDTFSSVGVLVGMLLVGFTGWNTLDPLVAATFVLVTVGMAAFQLKHVLHPLMDGALPESELRLLKAVLETHPEVRGYHNVRTRRVGPRRYVDLHVMLDDELSFVRAHELAEELEKEMGEKLSPATVSIHYEPHRAEEAHRAEAHSHEK